MRLRRHLNFKYACFACRKAFARETVWHTRHDATTHGKRARFVVRYPELTAACPQCGGVMYMMDSRFKPPPRSKVKAWAHWERAALQRYQRKLAVSWELREQVDPYFRRRK